MGSCLNEGTGRPSHVLLFLCVLMCCMYKNTGYCLEQVSTVCAPAFSMYGLTPEFLVQCKLFKVVQSLGCKFSNCNNNTALICTLHLAHCIHYYVHCTLCSVHCNVFCSPLPDLLYSPHCTLYTEIHL